jgi:hypothetical protein
MLTQELEIGVTKLNLQDVVRQYALQKRTYDRSASLPRDRIDWGEAVDVSQFCGRQAQLAMGRAMGDARLLPINCDRGHRWYR